MQRLALKYDKSGVWTLYKQIIVSKKVIDWEELSIHPNQEEAIAASLKMDIAKRHGKAYWRETGSRTWTGPTLIEKGTR